MRRRLRQEHVLPHNKSEVERQAGCGGHKEDDNYRCQWKINVPAAFSVAPPSEKSLKT
ncbi:hypothetical protein AGABI1DRAFT_115715 [Agaricus bisporus var. burnettii JB137-S8]|uniref:Uncharacterized protein n=1 Tax=Agaricus bisporus var. burnettii (strain JB137-S8 / ATCC MYA-4627 / FGSC 10392) TaxID=597362 RepID=K5X0K5_AGABU|nr:hypothetical protein AGABI2DRAFT_195067 [Agaricus bisporus var. bisporus H97]XP_007332795.1 uncharacterized protein AGABI1DRAFT_115715 [Agaricus bisporus var. burnettii JB137-S8]EKM76628.1 hypothetical protein AGABI1DRAFT_115715 [Agaricus bisporus var. burnettii JB137-S8]EKV43431.1 hypothetical protein AGABI2DRAFT_195067 [Agaricus bisporus var. bisporus H97]